MKNGTHPSTYPRPVSCGDRRTPINVDVYDMALGRCGGRRTESAMWSEGSDVMVVLYESAAYDLDVAPLGIARLSINLTSVPVFGGIASSRGHAYQGRRYSLFYAPATSDAHWCKTKPSRHLNIYFREDLIEELADGRAGILTRARALYDLHVRRVKPWIDALELSIGEPGRIAGDASVGLAHLIVAGLACSTAQPVPRLKAEALARVREYVSQHLGMTITVADLAALTNLSVGRFTRCFRASTGMSPHRFILSRRVEMARSLLRGSAAPMVEVAGACGFSSQQHMATVMRRLAGSAPSAIRREAGR